MNLTSAQKLKFRLLAEGIGITEQARHRLDELRGERKLTPADYASTSGLIFRLEDQVWVNAPFIDHNQNFVRSPRSVLDVSGDSFVVHGAGLESPASVWLPPLYHDRLLSTGRPARHFTFTHGDRVRLSPIRGCAMRCHFCNVPYDDPYERKPVASMLEALEAAFEDPLQPAQHIMISGGTPIPRDVPFLSDVYEQVLGTFSGRQVDMGSTPFSRTVELRHSPPR